MTIRKDDDRPLRDRAATPQGESLGTVPVAPSPARGTTHDPNSVTTGTPEEPTRDVYPPKGEDETHEKSRK
ncbi:hypothetical protein MWU52_17360 [Jannaschia sp. S6380]|uniref:hypothetical protein n=1 Tax=Jannaschia sp. S6380 TaxID=2926408 RepID=UPI001FF31D62|nr:hypothetical protein [Jannaschia sp. S6380]MCK0169325.1 hypothetical protein [Jannaschia sp. S6380]